MTFLIGIIGKPSAGKSTFLNAACLTNAKMSELPFTTIEPNKGVAYVKTMCVCKDLNLKDNPKNSYCLNGNRFIPINLLDVAGLVPDAHKGKGLGNRFLNDLIKADILIHIVDISGSLDKSGKRIKIGENDPYEDVVFLENEINLWFKQILEREDWTKFIKSHARERKLFIEELYKRLSGIKINKKQIILALKNSNLEEKNPSLWSEDDLLSFSIKLREISKPILILANKIDKEIGMENYLKLKNKIERKIIPCSALAEYFLRKYHEEKIIEYMPGSDDFKILDENSLNPTELEMLRNIQDKILNPLSETGIQNALNYIVFDILSQICVYPISDINKFSDNNDNVLPDAFLVEQGTLLRNFVRDKIHTDLADHFIFGIDARTKKRLGENYELKHNDIIKIVTAK
ncbi:MAG: YchF-related putative GTPase [Candidatus Lokiarchaeota archaeon]|jgi:ribosome-binding ATPase YchF (GTP1/OBG family)|nr:YchF-related putative GTPase [Candidatus Lokiarchaeota archaeon]